MSANWNGEEKPGDGCSLVVLLVLAPAIVACVEVLRWLA